MANKYKDEKGHFTTKENDGGPCHHDGDGDNRGVSKESWNKFSKEINEWEQSDEAKKSHAKAQRRIDYIKDLKSEGVDQDEAIERANKIYDEGGFDDDYDEEFKDYKVYEDKIREELNKVTNKEAAEYVSDLIDNNMEAGYISEEKADELYNELDKKIDEFSTSGNEDQPSGKIDDDFLDNMNDFPAIRKNPKTGEFEVDHDGDGNWSVIDEDEYNALKKKGYQEIDYEEEPDTKDDDDLEEGLDELEELVPDSQKNKVKKIKKDLAGDDDKRA